VNLELGYIPAATDSDRHIQHMGAWEAPRLPGLDHTSMRRWAGSPTWVPPESQLLVRHRSLEGGRRVVTNDRNPPRGFVIEFDLGLLHRFAQPGTRRLIASEKGYLCTQFDGVLDDGFKGLGYVEEAPFPMLDILELRRDPVNEEEILVAGVEDPLYDTAIPISSLGFIESYPINPRDAPHDQIDWGVTTLLRSADPVHWRHHYHVGQERASQSVALGGLWVRPSKNLTALYLSSNGRLTSDLVPKMSASGLRLRAKLRWAAAPLNWPEGRPRSWAARAAANRARMLIVSGTQDDLPSSFPHKEVLFGYLQRELSPGWSPLFSATHPALGDQYVTRSEIEATDMGYEIDGVLGYVLDRWADRSRDVLPPEIKWASRFGQHRRYIEGFHS
jgi:hypothetical protein